MAWMDVSNDLHLFDITKLYAKFCMTLSKWKDTHRDLYLSIRNANENLLVGMFP